MLSLNFTDIFINLLLPPFFSGAFHEEEKCKMEKISFVANVASKGGEKMETTKIDYFISSWLRCESAESAIGVALLLSSINRQVDGRSDEGF
jgi:hypothetical protein